eukprot:TRINITY_DN6049_c0_g1_i1.p1 TRINITY_DN6049_c0_g1~~TRINITY_DN6049_c0_g1_i1.p1  ORF type:complete len:375 (+),score=62.72 TRINITY_DN6049_c0_g1_i1:1068-2192(+)
MAQSTFLILPLLALVTCSLAKNIPLTLLDAATFPQAKCMDGTQGGYYYAAATNSAFEDNWVLLLQGGGECASQTNCDARVHTALGSSSKFDASKSDLEAVASGDCNENPRLCTWNRVFMAYCSQDLHSGTRAQPSSVSWNYSFAGSHIVQAVFDDLTAKYNFSSAETVILSGGSAGGIGVWYHLDNLADRLPTARVLGAPIAGYYFPAYPYTGINHTQSALADFRPAAWPSHVELWQSAMPKACVQAKPADKQWQCMLANFSYDYIKASVFITEAQTDQVVTTGHDWLPGDDIHQAPEQAYLSAWAKNMTQGLQRVMDSKNGVFNAACFIHTTFSNSKPLIRNTSYHQALLAWMDGQEAHYMDDCGVMCNPTCP